MRKISVLLGCLLLLSTFVEAQKTGPIDYPVLGISFTIPDGWLGQEGEGVFVMGSTQIPGLLLITAASAQSLSGMRQEAQAGIVDPQTGTNLQLQSDLETLSAGALGGEFSGTLENQPARAYVIGAYNPHGQSVTIMAATLEQAYSPEHERAAKSLWRSLSFRKPELPSAVDDWRERLNGVRLTYMESYSSIDYSNPNYTSGGGYSKEEKIDLCPEGYFNYNDRFDMSAENPGVSASQNNRQRGGGRWVVTANAAGEPLLKLSFHSGEIYEYVLSREGNKTFLNGTRYYRTWTGENAPVCH